MSNDIVSQSIFEITSADTITADGVYAGEAIDTEALCGIGFYVAGIFYGDGLYAFSVEESDTGSGDWSLVTPEKIIGQSIVISEGTDDFSILPKVGVFSNKRYLRPVVTATQVTMGVGGLVVAVVRCPKITPEPEQ